MARQQMKAVVLDFAAASKEAKERGLWAETAQQRLNGLRGLCRRMLAAGCDLSIDLARLAEELRDSACGVHIALERSLSPRQVAELRLDRWRKWRDSASMRDFVEGCAARGDEDAIAVLAEEGA